MGDHLFLQNFKQSFSSIAEDTEFINHFPGLHHQDNNLTLNLMGFPNHSMIFPPLENFPGLFIQDDKTVISAEPVMTSNEKAKKRKAKDISETTSPNTSAYSSPQVSDNATTKPNRGGRGKKAKDGDGDGDEKAGEVIHVRARRGQATDSHSLAERVRRGKINERLRCLQDIVPGCYKTMGMAVMLDEIINYVQSLQNQVEFLSMKLTTASAFHDFDSDTDAMKIAASQGLVPNPHHMNFGYYPHSL